MIRHAVAAAAAMIFCACSKAPPPPPVQYSPDTFTVAIHWHASEGALHQFARDHGQPNPVDGFTIMTWRGDAYLCDIHLVRPDRLTASKEQLLGHEFAHCLFGEWHL